MISALLGFAVGCVVGAVVIAVSVAELLARNGYTVEDGHVVMIDEG